MAVLCQDSGPQAKARVETSFSEEKEAKRLFVLWASGVGHLASMHASNRAFGVAQA
jgi:hypothetical protein